MESIRNTVPSEVSSTGETPVSGLSQGEVGQSLSEIQGTSTEDQFQVSRPNLIAQRLTASSSQPSRSQILRHLGISEARAGAIDQRARTLLSRGRSGAPGLRRDLQGPSVNEQLYLVHSLTKQSQRSLVDLGSINELFGNVGTGTALGERFEGLVDRGWLDGQDISSLTRFDNGSLDATIRDPLPLVQNLVAGASQDLRGDVAISLIENQAQVSDSDVNATDTRGRFAAGVSYLTNSASYTTKQVVDHFRSNPSQLRSFYSNSPRWARASIAQNVASMQRRISLSPTENAAASSVNERLRFGYTEPDRVAGQVAEQQDRLASYGLNPEDTAPYDAQAVIPTILSPANRDFIESTARQYGIEPELLAGVVAAEMEFDHATSDVIQDGVGRSFIGGLARPLLDGAGVASVHLPTLRKAIDYMQTHDLPGWSAAQSYDFSPRNRSSFQGSVEAAAITTAMLRHAKIQGGDTNGISTQDMATIWAGYRTGVGGISLDKGGDLIPRGEGGFRTIQDFANNRANGVENLNLPGFMNAGGNAYQSLPYFEFFADEF